MKQSSLRLGAALLLTLALAACGGKQSYSVTGTLVNSALVTTPLPNSGLVLANGSDTVSVPAGATTFALSNIDYGDSFNITVQSNPQHMTCVPYSGTSGSAGHNVAIAAIVECTQNAYALGGTISGLTTIGLVLANGPVTYTAGATDTAFTFGTAVAVGTTYGVTVLSSPAGQTCSVTKGTDAGVMGDAAIATVAVTCTTP